MRLVTKLIPQDLAFADTAPWRFDFVGTVNAPPSKVWASFIDNHSWTEWFKNCKDCRATSDRFEGVGSTRSIRVNGLRVDERFVAWEPERLWAFTGVAMNMAFASSLVERATFTELPGERTRIDYRMAVAPKRWASPLRRLVASQATKAFAVSFANLDRYLTPTP